MHPTHPPSRHLGSFYSLGESGISALRAAASRYGQSGAELAAIDRLAVCRAEAVDVRRLAPLGELAGLPWTELFR